MARTPVVLWSMPSHEEVAASLKRVLRRGGATVVSPFAEKAPRVPRLVMLFESGLGVRSQLGRTFVNWAKQRHGPVQGKKEIILSPVRTVVREVNEERELSEQIAHIGADSNIKVFTVPVTAGREEEAGRDILGLIGATAAEKVARAAREPAEAPEGEAEVGVEAVDLEGAGPGEGRGAPVHGLLRPRGKPRSVEIVPVFFATDRARHFNPSRLADWFTSWRANPKGLAYGICEVSVPAARHKVGGIERPTKLPWVVSFMTYEDPRNHFVLHKIEEMDLGTFQARMAAGLKTDSPAVLVFIHGYRVTFQDSLFKTAQLAYDLRFDGVPVCYSWPSEGNAAKYTVDEGNVEWTEPQLLQFLHWLLSTFPNAAVHLVAHSMGNRALTRVLHDAVIAKSLPQGCMFKQVILAAPDVDASTFATRAAVFHQAATRVTLYASEHDRALWLSDNIVHGYPRAGEAGEDLVVVPGIDTVDASDESGPVLTFRHSYATEQPRLLRDLNRLIRRGQAPPRGNSLSQRLKDKLPYWVFAPWGRSAGAK